MSEPQGLTNSLKMSTTRKANRGHYMEPEGSLPHPQEPSIFQCSFWIFVTVIFCFTVRGCSPTTNPKAGRPPLVGCPLIQLSTISGGYNFNSIQFRRAICLAISLLKSFHLWQRHEKKVACDLLALLLCILGVPGSASGPGEPVYQIKRCHIPYPVMSSRV
jgi:hypothetical protein